MSRSKGNRWFWSKLAKQHGYMDAMTMLTELYKNQELGINAIADIFFCNHDQLKQKLKSLGLLELSGRSPKKLDFSQMLFGDFKTSREMLTDLYCNQQLGMETIATLLGCCKSAIATELRHLGISTRKKGRPKGIIPGADRKLERREAAPENFTPTSRSNERRDCKNYEDCLTYHAIKDIPVIPCKGCNGEPQVNHFLQKEYILEFLKALYGGNNNSSPIIIEKGRPPGVIKEAKEVNEFSKYKYLEGIPSETY